MNTESRNTFTTLENELDHLRESLDAECLSVHREGKITTLNVWLRKSLRLKLVLQDDYPRTWPTSVKLEVDARYQSAFNNLKYERKTYVEEFMRQTGLELNRIVDENQSRCCMVKIYDEARAQIDQLSDQLVQTFDLMESKPKAVSGTQSGQKVKEKKTARANYHSDDEDDKPKFKGSEFIFQRIKWDQNIDKRQVIIGYIDRFKGIKEINFLDFKGVHDDKEGIPQHRIRYFKINETIVWDREKKIDLITGAGDIGHFFKTADSIEAPIECERSTAPVDTVLKGDLFQYINGDWAIVEPQGASDSIRFVGNLKILTYNIMSRRNFKKSVVTKSNGGDFYGLDALTEIDRMNAIVRLLETGDYDLIHLQECDDYEEAKLREADFVRRNYFLTGLDRNRGKLDHPNVLTLSRFKPAAVSWLKLSDESNKHALVVKLNVRTSSLRRAEQLVSVNVHLSSNLANNSALKRRSQLESLYKYLENDLLPLDIQPKHTILAGDFNFDDTNDSDQSDLNKEENQLMDKLFLRSGYSDLVPDVYTFDPTVNFCASVTASIMSSRRRRRYDRILYKNHTKSNVSTVGRSLVNLAPFQIQPAAGVFYEPYLNITTYTRFNVLNLTTSVNESKVDVQTDQNVYVQGKQQYFLHPSDHYGVNCTLKFEKSLHESNVVYKSTLAIVVPQHAASEFIQPVREEFDPQYERWPPHINLLYPFYEDISLGVAEDEEASVVGDILASLSRFKPFKCDMVKLNCFKSNNVVYLEPSKEAEQNMKLIYEEVSRLFADLSLARKALTPHLTIGQPVDKRKAPKNYAEKTLAAIKEKYKSVIERPEKSLASFDVDCVYWMKRTDNTPFQIVRAFPLGARFAPLSIGLGLNVASQSDQTGLYRFFQSRGLMQSLEVEENIKKIYQEISSNVQKSLKTMFGSLDTHSECSSVDFVMKNERQQTAFALLPAGSFMQGIKCNDLDLCLVNCATGKDEDEKFSTILAYNLSSYTNLFGIVRDVNDAQVPIIELNLKCDHVKAADVQIHHLQSNIEPNDRLVYDNLTCMKRIESTGVDFAKLARTSGIFENQNLKKYIDHYKDYQMVLSFVKHWAECRHIYGKAFGFLGGISWGIMVVYFLRKKAADFAHILQLDLSEARFGRLISAFFKFYATEFDWSTPVSLIDYDYIYQHTSQHTNRTPLVILQTVYPYYNTTKNVYDRPKKLIRAEIDRAWAMFDRSNCYDTYEQVCADLKMADLPSKRIEFKITCADLNDLTHIFVLVKAKVQGLITGLQRICAKCDFRPYSSLFVTGHTERTFCIGMSDDTYFGESERQLMVSQCEAFISTIKGLSYCANTNIQLIFN